MPSHTQIHERGLDSAEARERQVKYGRNIIPVHRVSALAIALRQFRSTIVLLMLAIGLISWAVDDVSGAVIIAVIIALNALIGFVQEYRAERTLTDVSTLVQPTAIVKRDQVFQQILREGIVVGDVAQVTAGTVVPADMELKFAEGLLVNESTISGESLPVGKSVDGNKRIEMGTVVTSGIGEGVVMAIGKQAVLGQIVNLSQGERITNFEREIRRLTELFIVILIVTLISLFALKLALSPTHVLTIDFVLFLLAICIGILPESLPLVTSVALSTGALKLSQQGVVVRNLSAIQDLGSITVLCSDKTGTLTENSLTATDTLICHAEMFDDILSISAGLQGQITDPFQTALSKINRRLPVETKLLHAIPFDPSTRSARFIVELRGREVTVSQGAYEAIVDVHSHQSCFSTEQVCEWMREKEKEGQRILAFTLRQNGQRSLGGLVSFTDPIRESAKNAIQHAKRLGISVKVLSGDSELVTASVARRLNLEGPYDGVVSGYDWDAFTEEQKRLAVKVKSAFGRFLPAQKYEVIRLLQESGEVVGYMGDGVNDAPSLKLADVGIAVSSGTDIAKDSSDVILLKPGLSVVVSGIERGRVIFENISKYLRETLTENIGNFLSISVLSLFIPYLPMLPVQILLTNLITDFPHLAIATDRVDSRAVRSPKHFLLHSLVRFMVVLSLVSSAADMIFFGFFRDEPVTTVQTGWFVLSVFAEIATIFSVRSRKLAFQSVRPSAMLTIGSAGVIGFILAAVTYRPLAEALRLDVLPLSALGLIAGVVAVYFLVFDVIKWAMYRRWPESY